MMKIIRRLFGLDQPAPAPVPDEDSGWYITVNELNVRMVSGRNHEIVMSSEVYTTAMGAIRSAERISRVTGLPLKVT